MKVLVTGVAGFIGMHVAHRLLNDGHEVVGIDNLNDYYDVSLKENRLKTFNSKSNFKFLKLDISNTPELNNLFESEKFSTVVALAAQAGVRYSLKNPHAYVKSNIVGFMNILECCRHNSIQHLVYASSSSVYGANTKMPFAVGDNVDQPVSLYAATKKSNELMAHTYSHLFNLPTTGLRFFTVYGPWGRPDMSPSLFAGAILNEKPIDVFNHGKMKRDFTYIDDIVEGVVRVLNKIPDQTPPYKLYNIGNNQPSELLSFISELETALNKKAVMNMLPMQPGDVVATYADIEELKNDVGFSPKTDLKTGLKKFAEWYKSYHGF
jgi:UDP-glucuronate 4-epimerase